MCVALIAMLALQAVPAAQTLPGAAQSSASTEKRRHAIRMMEAVLSQGVRSGAEHLAEQLGSGNPNMSFFTGQARARGFMIDDFGVFFHVEIPEMQQSLVMSVTTLERDVAVASTLESLRRAVDSFPDGAAKIQAEQALKSLQVQVGPITPIANPRESAAPGLLRATDMATNLEPVRTLPVLKDPNAAYREAIKAALIDAMLEHSRGLNLQPDEWLSVAARRGDSELSPNEIVTSSTLVLRIKGSDLALYAADRTRKDEIRARVLMKEF